MTHERSFLQNVKLTETFESLTRKVLILDWICKMDWLKTMMLQEFIHILPFYLLLLCEKQKIKCKERIQINSTVKGIYALPETA